MEGGNEMAESSTAKVLKRKAEQARSGNGLRDRVMPSKALQDAFRSAGEEELQLSILAEEPRERYASVPEILETLPDQAFLAVLLGPDDGVGLFCFDPAALAAVIEMRTMGRVSKHQPQARKSTRADAAMVIDLIDRLFADFEAPLLESDDARWASGWRYQLFLDDPRPLPVVLEDGLYRVLEIELNFGQGLKEGKAMIALPAEGRAQPQPAPSLAPESAAAQAAKTWARGMEAALGGAEACFDIVLGRLNITLGNWAALAEGDRVILPMSVLNATKVVASGGAVVGQGRLGQVGGVRALKVGALSGNADLKFAEGTILPACDLNSYQPLDVMNADLSGLDPVTSHGFEGANGAVASLEGMGEAGGVAHINESDLHLEAGSPTPVTELDPGTAPLNELENLP